MSELLDPRWQWVENRRLCDPEPTYLRGPCNHLERVDVESCVTGELVAQLCLTCDTQLPARFASRFDPPTTTEINLPSPAVRRRR